jgi:protein SCO1
MNRSEKRIEWIVWGGLILIMAAVAGFFAWSRLGTPSVPMPVLGQISDFTLTNQNNEPVSLATLRGKVWVADIIFTRCPGPCAKMTRRLAELQKVLLASKPVQLVTLTSDPDYDTPAVLKRYAERFGADPTRWWFLTGPKKEIRELAVNDFKFVVLEKQPGERTVPDDLFVHSTFYVVVDAKGQVRGWTDRQSRLHACFDSEDPATQEQIVAAVRQLVNEQQRAQL